VEEREFGFDFFQIQTKREREEKKRFRHCAERFPLGGYVTFMIEHIQSCYYMGKSELREGTYVLS
jgi:hypothetical protein